MQNNALLSIIILHFLFVFSLQAQRGKSGPGLINASGVFVNEYTSLTADAFAGSESIKVANSGLNFNNRFLGKLSTGDLVMIIQIQGAGLQGNVTDTSWGEIASYNNCGLNEFREVKNVPDTATITFTCPLMNNYSDTGVVQVIRVPRYSALTVNKGASINCPAWNGQTGGVIAIEVLGNSTINGSIDASGNGFRGGVVFNELNNTSHNISSFADPNVRDGANKGEGIAGFMPQYTQDGGPYGRGAPANGGGGGDSWNAGGGGGSNAGNKNGYTGYGNPDISKPYYLAAWNLEYNTFANSLSSGGGRGGYTWANCGPDPIQNGPGNSIYSADDRRNVGGQGGRPLDYSTGRLFLGGGGGAGQEDNGSGSGGGNGGGIVYLMAYGTVAGNGSVTSNGDSALPAQAPNPGGFMDGAGGGGGGGTVIINSIGAVSGISTMVAGGKGGNQNVGSDNDETEGPGGGGGGGYIGLSNGTISTSVLGGVNGVTTAACMDSFPPNGSTSGGFGQVSTVTNYYIQAPSVSVCDSTISIKLTASLIGNVPPGTTLTWYDSITGGTVLGTGNTLTISGIKKMTVFYFGVCPGTYRVGDTANLSPPAFTFKNTSVLSSCKGDCDGSASAVVVSGGIKPYSYSWNTGAEGMTVNSVCAGIYTVNILDSNNCRGTDTVQVKIASESSFMIPNVITPNGDGQNDDFEIKGFSTGNYSVSIYDRWGLEMFKSESAGTLWNGKDMQGDDVPSGVYYYIVKTSCGSTDFDGHGFIQVIR